MEDVFLGEIRAFAGLPPAKVWAPADGALLAIAEHEPLFNVIGIQFGGDGRVTFALPDLRGRVVVGEGQARDGTDYVLGMAGGEEVVRLTPEQMPAHRHRFRASSKVGVNGNPQDNTLSAISPTSLGDAVRGYAPPDDTALQPLAEGSIVTAGGGEGHDNMQPFAVVGYFIAIHGLAPRAVPDAEATAEEGTDAVLGEGGFPRLEEA